MMDIDPEVAYEHAKAAYERAARIDIVREALGLTAYVTERYSEALRELRTYRRMSDDYAHVPLEADSERGLGRPAKALRFIEGIPLKRLSPVAQIELALVTSGARAETGDSEGGLRAVEKILIENLPEDLGARVALIKADRLEELGRADEATGLRKTWEPILDGADKDLDMVFDLADVLDDLPEEQPEQQPAAGEAWDTDSTDEDIDPDAEAVEEFEDSIDEELEEAFDEDDFEDVMTEDGGDDDLGGDDEVEDEGDTPEAEQLTLADLAAFESDEEESDGEANDEPPTDEPSAFEVVDSDK